VELDKRLVSDSEYLATFKLSELRLLKDGDLDWFLLIPLKENIIDWCDLKIDDQKTLCEEIDFVSRLLKSEGVDKINVGSLGNMVPQLHIHIIGRMKSDRAWPNAIWGTKSINDFDSSRVDYWKSKV
jgi:diadenosine tetraphosphate (Ap4A) HIT family hydrolase